MKKRLPDEDPESVLSSPPTSCGAKPELPIVAVNGENRDEPTKLSTRLGRRANSPRAWHYESQGEDEEFAEIEAAGEAEGTTMMAVPIELAPEVRARSLPASRAFDHRLPPRATGLRTWVRTSPYNHGERSHRFSIPISRSDTLIPCAGGRRQCFARRKLIEEECGS